MSSSTTNSSLTVGELLTFLLPRLRSKYTRTIPPWPADVFGLMAVLIQRSGAYNLALQNWPPKTFSLAKDYAKETRNLADLWLLSHSTRESAPSRVVGLWDILVENYWDTPILDFGKDEQAAPNALLLLAIADEGSLVTTRGSLLKNKPPEFWEELLRELKKNRPVFGVQREIPLDRLVVLPKRRTPQSGLNVRSLSHHLCAIEGSEVRPSWNIKSMPSVSAERLNLLILPWPFEIRPTQFQPLPRDPLHMANMPDEFGFFCFSPRSGKTATLEKVFKQALQLARAQVGTVHGVVLPECSILPEDWDALSALANEEECFLLAGVGSPETDNSSMGTNELRLKVNLTEPFIQKKHHRWQLDQSQIEQYQLSSVLNPNRKWWEYIDMKDRQVGFHQIADWLCLAPLICEDLARPDPVGEIVRSVGPDLVITLLMDGPQLKTRWTARNATTLADDPGCAVLTLTSLGMIALSNTRQPSPRIVPALYKDPFGPPQEIEFPPKANAAVLTLANRPRTEWSADGRRDTNSNSCPTLSSVRFLTLDAD